MSFSLHRFGSSASLPLPPESVANGTADGKLPVSVINLDSPYGSPGFRCFSPCRGGVQEIESCSDVLMWVVPKLKQGEITSLPDVKRKHLKLMAGSGLDAEILIDVGVRDGAKNGPGLEKLPKIARDVPVRYALVGAGPGPVCSRRQWIQPPGLVT